jgi:putative PIN family toxin of toxin-antitoxin system
VTPRHVPRVVFDTNTVISALVFTGGRLAWLRLHWRDGLCSPLVSKATVKELLRVLGYAKFQISAERSLELQSDYLPYCITVEQTENCSLICRDPKDQPFLDLAYSGKASILVTGDQDLLLLSEQAAFAIETPEQYQRRFVA